MESNVTRPQAKYFFLHIGIIALLYTSISTFITFAFDVINYLFPDRQAYAFDPYGTTLRVSVSTLIVVFPVLIYLSRLVYKELVAHPEDRTLAIRRWLSYLTIFLSSVAVVIDLIVLINTFLDGEITTRFFAKFAVVLLVAAAVFWYTLRDLKGIYFEKPQLLKIFTIIVSVIILASIVSGLIIIGSPTSKRKLRDDMDRIQDLSSIQWDVLSYYQRTGALPESLDTLKDDFSHVHYEERFTDPVSNVPYEYKKITGTTSIAFELCATFDLATREDLEGRGTYGRGGYGMDYSMTSPTYPGEFDQNFKHTVGRNCFTRTIDPVKYPVYNPQTPVVR